MWRVACCRSLVGPAGIAILMVRGVSPVALVRLRTKNPLRAATAKHVDPRRSRKVAGKNSRSLIFRRDAEHASIAAVTAVAADAEPDLRSVREAAEFASVTPNTVRVWVREGKLTSYGTPGKRLVDFNELNRMLRQGPTGSGPPRKAT
jgi:helix-turn-helix protein